VTVLTRSDYKTAMSSQTDALLADRGRIDSSHRMMDETLGYALFLLLPVPLSCPLISACFTRAASRPRHPPCTKHIQTHSNLSPSSIYTSPR
jgi:hypothetical protein